MATPLVKSLDWFSTFEPCRPDTAPVSGELAVTVTLFVAALKLVIVFPPMSWAVSVLVPVKATPSVWVPAAAKVK